MPTTITYTGKLVVVGACWNCSSNQAIPERLYEQASNYGKTFYCSSCGESQVYKQTEVARLRAELASQEGNAAYWRAEATAASNRERAQKAAKTRIKNRISNGVCPCCKRHFANVERHIKGQHPEFAGVQQSSTHDDRAKGTS